MNRYFILLIVGFFLLVGSCANYKRNYSPKASDWETKKTDTKSPKAHSIYLIGNTGVGSESREPTLQFIKSHLDQAPENSTVLFLGNQSGHKGMPSKSEGEKRKAVEQNLDKQLNILTDFKGQPIFLAGLKDWNFYGIKGVKRQEKYIESALNKAIEDEDEWNNYFLPDNTCPGPEVIEINEDLVVIIIDSQWWLADWDDQPNINNGCEVKSRESFELLVKDAIKDNKHKNIVFACNHPLESVGSRGGYFTAKQHLLPPVLGTGYAFLRNAGIQKQDLSNRNYKALIHAITHPAQLNGEFIFVSGGEQNLQYIKEDGQHFVNSGAASKVSGTAKRKKAMFSAGRNGFSKIDFYEDGSVYVEFWECDKGKATGSMVFRYQMKGPLPKVKKEDMPLDFPEYESKMDSIIAFPSSRKIKPLGNFATTMLGKRRRALYEVQHQFPVLDLSTFKGGLTVIKKGGGNQTNSLRLLAPDGKEYVLRSLTKDATRGVPFPFNQLPYVNFLFSETFLGVHCFAPPTLPVMADAANIYHTNPNLYYIPKQPALGIHNDVFGGEVYLVEERPSQKWPDAAFFGNAEKFTSTYKLNLKREKNLKHRVDQKWLVRSRLFDMMIGDIDRHGDQWRWTVTETDKGYKLYRPIPRDRDNAYGSFDGLAFKLLRPYHPLVRQLSAFDEDPGNPKWSYYNARHFDHNFTNEMTLEDWKSEAKYIQENVTDDIIEEGLSFFSDQVYDINGDQVKTTLTNRRDNLQKIAEDFYLQLARKSIIQGSNKREYFEVIRKDDEHTEINMYACNKKGEKKERVYHRVFKTSETKEIFIYGLGGDDRFHISGIVKKGITLQIVGGAGKDEFVDESKVGGMRKKDNFFDTKKGNTLNLGSEGKNRTSNIAKNNIFEPLGSQFDESFPLIFPIAGYNAGDGVKIGVSLDFKDNKFNKAPVGQHHKIGASFAFATNGANLFYEGVFYETNKHWDFVINGDLRGDRYSFNYFGIGNDTSSENDNLDDNRVQQSRIYLDFGWQRRFGKDIGIFSLRPMVHSTEITDTGDKFIDRLGENGLTEKDFENRWYGGLITSLNFANTNNDIHPKDGFRFKNSFSWQQNLSGSDRKFQTYSSDFTLYKSFGRRGNLILATRAGTSLIRGDYDFFFAPALGQDENIRGYFGQRFRGATNIYHTTDLRMGIAQFKNSLLPFSMGLTGSFDYGRIFEPGEDSNTWHKSIGGGIWLVPLNIMIVSVSYNRVIDEGTGRFLLGIGHAF